MHTITAAFVGALSQCRRYYPLFMVVGRHSQWTMHVWDAFFEYLLNNLHAFINDTFISVYILNDQYIYMYMCTEVSKTELRQNKTVLNHEI